MTKRIGIQILSFNKPDYLQQTLNSLLQVIEPENDKVCVIEQSDKDNMQNRCIEICNKFPAIQVLKLDRNFGQRGATNILFNTKFWDDCEYVMLSDHDNLFHSNLEPYIDVLVKNPKIWIASGYNSPEHDMEREYRTDNNRWFLKSIGRAGHMVMRKDDFYSVMPAHETFGNSSWYCGLDFWLCHWSPASPGQIRPEFIACLSGGVEHIGRESTWQGKYDDEYTQEEHDWMNNLDTPFEDIIKRFPPRHIYVTEKYWYETEIPEVKISPKKESRLKTLMKKLFS